MLRAALIWPATTFSRGEKEVRSRWGKAASAVSEGVN